MKEIHAPMDIVRHKHYCGKIKERNHISRAQQSRGRTTNLRNKFMYSVAKINIVNL